MKPRVRWHVAANSGVVLWLLALLATTLTHPFLPEARWLMVHLLLLGAVTNAILVWSTHFARALLRAAPSRRRWEAVRLLSLNIGVATVVAGVVGQVWQLALFGALVVGASAAAHGISLLRLMRRALPGRFGTTIHHYVGAALMLPVGAILGTLLAREPADPVHGRLLVAHLTVNVLGWVGLTVIGTVLTLWPTILRTRIPDGAERSTRRSLPVLVLGLSVVGAGAAAGALTLAALGVVTYLCGALWSLSPLLVAARTKPPQSYAAWSVLAATGWFVVSVAWFAMLLATAPDWAAAGESGNRVAVPLAVGFAAQVLLGALTHLVPVVLGGGPARVRELNATLERGAALRVVVANTGLLVCLLPSPSLVRVLVSMLVLGAMASFVPLLGGALRRSQRPIGPVPTHPARHVPEPGAVVRGRHTGMGALGLAAVVLAVAAGAAADPSALGGVGRSAAGGISATGATTTVRVEARGMRFHPDRVAVPAGNRLVVELANADEDVHDLALESGERSGRIAPGSSGRLEVPVVGRGLDGWCTIAGHRQMGMLFAVEVTGLDAATRSDSVEHAATGHSTQENDSDAAPRQNASPAPRFDFMAAPLPGFRARDAALPPASPSRTHHVELTVREVEREVGVGVRQRLWTFNGTTPGPVLRGRVGDRFVITLHNEATIGHSVDFHAGSLAPDGAMRTIAPGSSHTFSFTATRAGVWMYHCSTMPMSLHIASGMFGAVVIDPPGLAPVDREYLLVQSELYPGLPSADADKVNAERPDAVVFNGFANQYDHDPLRAGVGERVRLWVLDAGPNRASSFHVVGGQFDTVFAEGAFSLRPGSPGSVGGAQSLGLHPAQGGFVELALPEPGHYPFVSHLMVDAERGAHGVLEVTAP